MKRYIILEERFGFDLSRKVEEYLKDGWALQGGVSMSKGHMYDYYCQAMVK